MSPGRLYPRLSALRAAEAAARLGGFTAAAEELNISQSAVSQAVRVLEDHLGTALFERRSGGIVPTAKGKDYIDAIIPALAAIAAAGHEISRQGRNRLTIGCIRSLLHNWLLPRLPLFSASHPDFDLNVLGIGRDIAEERECHLAIILEDLDRPPAGATLIAREILVPVTSQALASTLTSPLEEYGELPAALLGTGWNAWCRVAGLQENITHDGSQFRDASAALEAARAGQGIALGGTLICLDDISANILVPVSDIRLERGRGYWLLGKESGSPAGASFRSWLSQLVKEASAQERNSSS